MSNIIQRVNLLTSCTPLMQFQRYRGKINIQRPRKPHYERARVLAVTAPIYPEVPKTSTCFMPSAERYQKQVENPYNDIIAREVRNWLTHSCMVGFYHVNSIKQEDLFPVRVQLHKQNMHLKSYGRKIIAKAVANTKFEAILQLFDSNYCMIFSSEQRVAQMLRITRKVPQMLLLAGIVDDRLLSRNEIIEYAQLPNLASAQAELAQTLNMAASNLVQQLEAHQNNFVNVLDVYAKGQSEDTAVASPTDEMKKE